MEERIDLVDLVGKNYNNGTSVLKDTRFKRIATVNGPTSSDTVFSFDRDEGAQPLYVVVETEDGLIVRISVKLKLPTLYGRRCTQEKQCKLT